MAVDGIDKLPRSILVLLAGLFLVLVLAIGGAGASDLDKTKKTVAEHEVKIAALERRFDRFDDKLDRIGERLGVKI